MTRIWISFVEAAALAYAAFIASFFLFGFVFGLIPRFFSGWYDLPEVALSCSLALASALSLVGAFLALSKPSIYFIDRKKIAALAIVGLGTGMSCCSFLLLFVNNHHSPKEFWFNPLTYAFGLPIAVCVHHILRIIIALAKANKPLQQAAAKNAAPVER